MDHSQASVLLSTPKFAVKASQVVLEGLQCSPKHIDIEKKLGYEDAGEVKLVEKKSAEAGMMLYTSGTTARPVSFTSYI